LLLYTDGILDALSPAEEQFSEARLIDAAASPAPSAQALLENIMRALDLHIGQRQQYDDVTLLGVHRKE
jgi:serine phosphatase RsbU (regulator of sigma subunit)